MIDPLASFRLDGRVAVVTGASSGLGAVFAEALAQVGAKVVVAARRVERLEELVSRLETQGAEALAVACDVMVESDIDGRLKYMRRDIARILTLQSNQPETEAEPAEAKTETKKEQKSKKTADKK